jgi:hypothetical protein
MHYWILALLLLSFASRADELSVNAGFGPQAHASQDNRGGGLDWEFWRKARSSRQFFSIGAGYTRLKTDAVANTTINAFSLYPQLTLLTAKRGEWQPYFYVRALGPTVIDHTEFGERKQGEHFLFQAGVGAGLLAPGEDWFVAIGYKHFSNAKLFSPNDSMELPLQFTIGRRW